jgi:hypothetical protein
VGSANKITRMERRFKIRFPIELKIRYRTLRNKDQINGGRSRRRKVHGRPGASTARHGRGRPTDRPDRPRWLTVTSGSQRRTADRSRFASNCACITARQNCRAVERVPAASLCFWLSIIRRMAKLDRTIDLRSRDGCGYTDISCLCEAGCGRLSLRPAIPKYMDVVGISTCLAVVTKTVPPSYAASARPSDCLR